MKHKEVEWGWMLAVDFFFAGMGGGMLFVAGLLYLINGADSISTLGTFVGIVFIGVGSAFLSLELGRPFQAWRVFMNPKALLTWGAWNMVFVMGAAFIYVALDFTGIAMPGLQTACAVVMLICGLFVATYPGVLLGLHAARPFWTGPGIVVIFLTSSLLTGLAAHDMANYLQLENSNLKNTILGLIFFQLLVWALYLYVKISGNTSRESEAAKALLTGPLSGKFVLAFLVLGNIVPIGLYMMTAASVVTASIAALCILAGSYSMRFVVVKMGEKRTLIIGEKDFMARLPKGDELFLDVLK
ncbi:Formate-dependent nitrite reductase, membrane component NrfD [Desulfuromusa kysingii]|uniref:Formate-dependent nitrite reductase, membrane component NrfD n=1 Tax=Desulfuromusa kysingii TaxID=37625 RepID=A0A1H4A1Z6_9BACT|nr:NrfD/PsrC family molybdoenzyme membrane anchor subunit [Desulfuromusa kysingii]SEA30183.1 Formate-dependent nitrite reductase, membrane component NrfD [Desulfuromusa kysingii]